MKKIVLFIAALAIISCSKETPVDYAILSGKIANKGGELTINSFDRTVKEDIKVSDDGTFSDTLRLKKGTYILFDGRNRTQVYLDAGATINVEFDAKDFKNTLKFSGVGSEVSSYLQQKGAKTAELSGEGTSLYVKEEADYVATIASIKSANTDLLNGIEGIPEDFKAKELRNLNYEMLGKKSIYQLYHGHYAKKPDFKVSEGFTDDIDALDFNNEEDFLFSQDYKRMVSSHYSKKAMELMRTDSLERDIALLHTVGAIENQTIKDALLLDNSRYNITYTENLEEFYNTFKKYATNEEHIKEITESYTKLKSVAKGQPSPKFVNYENYAGGTTSLDDLKGKFVYVDVWATWCGPCKAEIPFLKEVEKKYHGKNIEFVSISVDVAKDHEKWKEMIAEKELGGIQLFADNDWSSQFVQDYLIKGIPRFILIDTEGNIVSSNAPRPSSPKLIEMFDENNI